MFKEGQENQPDQEIKKMRERVDDLQKTDNTYEDSVHTLAENENEIREKLKKSGAGKEDIGELADIFSTKDLERMEAEKEKWTDTLTGLRNKNAYNEEAPQLLGIERRQNNNCSLLIVDLDYFKKVNDKYGHDAGDEVLKKIAEMLKKTIRSSDMIYRFGGEEFVIFLPATSSLRAVLVAEKIRAKIEESIIEVADARGKKSALKKTVSIGCVGTDQMEDWNGYNASIAAEFLKKMFNAADLSVISSKENGRNQVTLYSEDLSSK